MIPPVFPPQFNVFRNITFREDGCFQWTGSFFGSGYPRVSRNWKSRRAHRWMYEEFVGPIPAGMHVHHTCENKWCVRPGHLELITATAHNALHKTGKHYHHKRRRV